MFHEHNMCAMKRADDNMEITHVARNTETQATGPNREQISN